MFIKAGITTTITGDFDHRVATVPLIILDTPTQVTFKLAKQLVATLVLTNDTTLLFTQLIQDILNSFPLKIEPVITEVNCI